MGLVTRADEHLVVSSRLFPHGKSQQSESGIISAVFWESLGWKHVSQLAGMPYLWGHLRLSLLTKRGIKWDLRTCRTSWQRVPNARMSRRWLFGSSKNKGLPTPISRHMQKCIYIYAYIHICDVVPRFKFKLFQLFLKSVRVLPLISVGLRLVSVYGIFLPHNYLVCPKNLPTISAVLASDSPIFFFPWASARRWL